VQAHADVELPIGKDGRLKPLSLYFITIAESGERKSESDYQALWAVRKHEKNLQDEYHRALPGYINDKIAWDKAREVVVKAHKGIKRYGARLLHILERDLPLAEGKANELRPRALAAHMAVTNIALLELVARTRSAIAGHEYQGGGIKRLDVLGNLTTKFMRIFTMQVEALARKRRKGGQRVTVKHVHVHAGGQAVVGNISNRGGG
jgi:hypothetical protein